VHTIPRSEQDCWGVNEGRKRFASPFCKVVAAPDEVGCHSRVVIGLPDSINSLLKNLGFLVLCSEFQVITAL
jgi:hypothetical protein